MVASLSLAGWSLIVGLAGLVIATSTFFTNRQAIRREQADRTKAIDDAWAFEWAAQRPVVYPVLSRMTTEPRLPLKNGGRGPALNVVAELEYRTDQGDLQGTWRFVVGTIAAGDIETGVLGSAVAPPWHGVCGVLRYSDLAGGDYTTPFSFSMSPLDRLELTVEEQLHRTAAEVTGAS